MDYLGALKLAKEAGIGEADFKLRWEEEKQKEKEEKQREREERAKDREEKEKEREFELKKLELEMAMREKGMRNDSDSAKLISKTIKLNPFDDSKEDLDSFLKRFERLSKANGFSEETWADRLGALLSGKALDVYSGLSEEDSRDYEVVKKVLFKKYLLTAEGYRKKFRNTKLDREETYTQLSVRLTRYFERWRELSESENTVEGLIDLLVREQMLRVVDPALAIYLKERDPKSLGKMVELADLYWDAHSTRRGQEQKVSKVGSTAGTQGDSGRPVCFMCGSPNHLSKQCDQKTKTETTAAEVNQGKSQRENGRGCYACGELDHIARFCKKRREVLAAMVLIGDEEDFQYQSPSSRINADPGHECCRAHGEGTGDSEVCPCGESMKGFGTIESPGYEHCEARNGELASANEAQAGGFKESTGGYDIPKTSREHCEAHDSQLASANEAHAGGFEESTGGCDIPMTIQEQCEAHGGQLASANEAHAGGFEESTGGYDIPMTSREHCEAHGGQLAGGSEARLGGFEESTGGYDVPMTSREHCEAHGGQLAGGSEARLCGFEESTEGYYDILTNSPTAPFLGRGTVGGKEVSVLKDSGCTSAVIRRSKLPPNSLTGKHKSYVMIDGTAGTAPVAEVWVETPFYTGLLRALVVENPVVDVIIGNRMNASFEIVGALFTLPLEGERNRVEGENGNESNPLNTDDARDEGGQVKVSGDCQLGKLTPSEVAIAQTDDETLKTLRERATGDQQPDMDNVSIIKRNGMYFRVIRGLEGRADAEQLLVPKRFREDIMKNAHEGTVEDSLDLTRIQDRIMQSFFWPEIEADVARFCRSGDACQGTECKGRMQRVPLVPIHLKEVPLQKDVEPGDDESVGQTVAAAIEEDREGDCKTPTLLDGTMPQLDLELK